VERIKKIKENGRNRDSEGLTSLRNDVGGGDGDGRRIIGRRRTEIRRTERTEI